MDRRILVRSESRVERYAGSSKFVRCPGSSQQRKVMYLGTGHRMRTEWPSQFYLIFYKEVRRHHQRTVDVVAAVFGNTFRNIRKLPFSRGYLESCVVETVV
jgi:hypothetical protein